VSSSNYFNRERKVALRENRVYSRILTITCYIGGFITAVSFFIYMCGLVEPLVPLSDLPSLWTVPSKEIGQVMGFSTGWGWVSYLPRSDILCFVGLSLIASGTVVAYFSMLFIYIWKRNFLYSVIILLELAVLVLVAAGLVTPG
jgi:hypothetical protein